MKDQQNKARKQRKPMQLVSDEHAPRRPRASAEFAEQHGAQVWLEKVWSDGRTGFVIEDGAVVAAKAEDAA